jgi:hypothetical protein
VPYLIGNDDGRLKRWRAEEVRVDYNATLLSQGRFARPPQAALVPF